MRFSPAILGVAGVTFLLGCGVGYLTGFAPRRPIPIALPVVAESTKSSQAKGKPLPRKIANETTNPITLTEFQEMMKGMRWQIWGNRNFRTMADLQDRLAISDLEGLVTQLAQQPNLNSTEFSLLFNAYGERDVEKALATAKSLKTKEAQQMGIAALLETVAASDPERVLAILETIDDPEIQAQARSIAVMALAEQ